MKFLPTRIPDVVLVEPRVFGDSRGFFLETWQSEKFAAGGLKLTFVQDNHSRSAQWVLRGLHYQVSKPQGKLVRVTRGAVFDVAVDMRARSPTRGQWVGAELSEDNHRMLWVPPGFAHGFLTLTESVDFIYKCTEFYEPSLERVLRWDDPTVGIAWPLPGGVEPQVSARDAQGVGLADAEFLD